MSFRSCIGINCPVSRTIYRDFADLSMIRSTMTIISWPNSAPTQEKTLMTLLHIDSSPLAGNSVSRQLTERIVAQWRATHPGTVVEYLDLAADAPSHLSVDS